MKRPSKTCALELRVNPEAMRVMKSLADNLEEIADLLAENKVLLMKLFDSPCGTPFEVAPGQMKG